MTKETFEKAKQIVKVIDTYDAEINSLNKALTEQTLKTAYPNDTLSVEIYNGNGKATTVFIPRKFIIDMLNSVINKYQAKMDEWQADLDVL